MKKPLFALGVCLTTLVCALIWWPFWNSSSTSPSITNPPVAVVPQSELLALLKQTRPDLYQDIAIHGTNSSGTMLLFLVKRGGTYLVRKDSGTVEVISNAKLIRPSQITRITYEDDYFKLWADDRLELSLGLHK